MRPLSPLPPSRPVRAVPPVPVRVPARTAPLLAGAVAVLLSIVLGAALLAPAARAADPWYVQAGGTWSEDHIAEADGTSLHADILRPKDLPKDARTPVILSIGPYFNHAGQTGVSDSNYDPLAPNGPQPSDRFKDFVSGSHLLQRGYTYVMVDLRGFGGSTGCLDWAGPGEQADVKAAVEWAASRAWSTGSVGMYGKSYDGVTGLIGEAQQPRGLAGIVAQEPVYDLYRYLYTNGVRYFNSLATPALYDSIAATPGPATDNPQYNADAINDTQRPGCAAQNYNDQAANTDHSSPYWKQRDLIAATRGHAIPLLLTQGFLENNTKPDGAWDFFNGLAGPKRAWFGMWDHIRGNDVKEGDNAAPQPWYDEVMRFYDHYVRGVPLADAATTSDPPVSTETSDGSWRSEQQWPPADSTGYTSKLKSGTYSDDASNAGSAEGAGSTDTTGRGVWTISPPLPHDAHLAGVPSISLDVTSPLPNANLSADVYDISPAKQALLLSRTAYLLSQGENRLSGLQMYGNDWQIPAGHRLGVMVSTANDEWWQPTPSGATVVVNGGSITLPFLTYSRTSHIPGKRPDRLDVWLKAAPFTLSDATLTAGASSDFALPPAQQRAPAGGVPASAPGSAGAGSFPSSPIRPAVGRRAGTRRLSRIHVRLRWRGRAGLFVYGDAPAGWALRVRVSLGRRRVSVALGRASRYGTFRFTLRVRRRAPYTVRVTASRGRQHVAAAARAPVPRRPRRPRRSAH